MLASQRNEGGREILSRSISLALKMICLGYSDERLESGDCRNFTNGEENVDSRALEWMLTSVTATKIVAFSSERSLCLTRGKACLKSAMLLLVCSP